MNPKVWVVFVLFLSGVWGKEKEKEKNKKATEYLSLFGQRIFLQPAKEPSEIFRIDNNNNNKTKTTTTTTTTKTGLPKDLPIPPPGSEKNDKETSAKHVNDTQTGTLPDTLHRGRETQDSTSKKTNEQPTPTSTTRTTSTTTTTTTTTTTKMSEESLESVIINKNNKDDLITKLHEWQARPKKAEQEQRSVDANNHQQRQQQTTNSQHPSTKQQREDNKKTIGARTRKAEPLQTNTTKDPEEKTHPQEDEHMKGTRRRQDSDKSMESPSDPEHSIEILLGNIHYNSSNDTGNNTTWEGTSPTKKPNDKRNSDGFGRTGWIIVCVVLGILIVCLFCYHCSIKKRSHESYRLREDVSEKDRDHPTHPGPYTRSHYL